MSWDWDFGEYPDNWDEISESIKRRDKWTCQVCGRHSYRVDHLEAHHIRSNKKGGSSTSSNLITVCDWCHGQIHPHVTVKSNPPTNRSEAKRRAVYVKNHSEASASRLKERFGPSKKKASASCAFPILMVISLALISVNFVLWAGVEILLAIAWGMNRRQGVNPKNGSITKEHSKGISLGSKVKIRYEADKTAQTYTIKEEMDFANNDITPQSPVGNALIGRQEGDVITVDMPDTGEQKITILEIQK